MIAGDRRQSYQIEVDDRGELIKALKTHNYIRVKIYGGHNLEITLMNIKGIAKHTKFNYLFLLQMSEKE